MSDVDIINTRNPDWSTDEHILALDLYFKNRGKLLDDKHPEIISLSNFLRTLAVMTGVIGKENFRNANGVAMKLANFSRLDPLMQERGLTGLPSGNKTEKVLWEMYESKPEALSEVAMAIKASVSQAAEIVKTPTTADSYEVEAEEGKILTKLHQYRERDRSIIKKKKEQYLKLFGKLKCEVCEFDYKSVYGERGNEFIEVHHIRPLHTLHENSKTRLDDLALVCANCHRMIHAKRPWLSIEELRQLVTSQISK